jgi:hypothetical protein
MRWPWDVQSRAEEQDDTDGQRHSDEGCSRWADADAMVRSMELLIHGAKIDPTSADRKFF